MGLSARSPPSAQLLSTSRRPAHAGPRPPRRRRSETSAVSARAIRALSLDHDYTLPGESTATDYPDDAEHWIAVYTELLKTTRQMIWNIQEMVEKEPRELQDQVERTDLRLLALQVQRFERRLALWRSKLAEIRS